MGYTICRYFYTFAPQIFTNGPSPTISPTASAEPRRNTTCRFARFAETRCLQAANISIPNY